MKNGFQVNFSGNIEDNHKFIIRSIDGFEAYIDHSNFVEHRTTKNERIQEQTEYQKLENILATEQYKTQLILNQRVIELRNDVNKMNESNGNASMGAGKNHVTLLSGHLEANL